MAMTEEQLAPETDEREDAIVESLSELRQSPEAETGEPIVEDTEESVASTDASPDATPEDEAPEPHVEQEPSQASIETDEERDLRQARIIAQELRERPELGDALVALKQGKATLIDKQIIDAAQTYMREQAAPPDDFEEKFWSDPVAAFKELREELTQARSWQEQQVQARYQSEVQANQQLAESVGTEWSSAHPNLTDEQKANIIARADESQLIASYYKRHGDKNRAFREGLDAALRIEYPELIASKAKDEAIRNANRARRAGQTAASPRPASRRPEESPTPKNSAERINYIADLIRETRDAQQ